MLSVFKIRREERPVALVALLVFVLLNALMIYKYYDRFTLGGELGFWSIFYKTFHVSGFDAFSYITLSNLRIHFVTSRHPFFLTILLPFYWLNHWLMSITGYNFAVYFMAAIIIFCAFYSFIFVYRTFRCVMDMNRNDSILLTAFLYSFSHIMLATMVPDHFCISLFLLSLTVYLTGLSFKNRKPMKALPSACLFFLTSGITLTNGVKTCLAVLFANGKKTFAFKMIFAFLLSAVLLFGIWQWQYHCYEIPQEKAIHKIEKTLKSKDPNFENKHKKHDAFVKAQNGKAVDNDAMLLKWSDMTTSRMRSVKDNLFGESIQLHRQHLLEDVQQQRPVFVTYDWIISDIIEIIIVLLFIGGVICGIRSRLMWLLLSWFLFDMTMHVGFGFGLNEVYIMAAHWAFIIPVAIAFLWKRLNAGMSRYLRTLILTLTVWLFCYNGSLIVQYMLK